MDGKRDLGPSARSQSFVLRVGGLGACEVVTGGAIASHCALWKAVGGAVTPVTGCVDEPFRTFAPSLSALLLGTITTSHIVVHGLSSTVLGELRCAGIARADIFARI